MGLEYQIRMRGAGAKGKLPDGSFCFKEHSIKTCLQETPE